VPVEDAKYLDKALVRKPQIIAPKQLQPTQSSQSQPDAPHTPQKDMVVVPAPTNPLIAPNRLQHNNSGFVNNRMDQSLYTDRTLNMLASIASNSTTTA
jgi:hypothetical protein